jgi:iron complex outermembrane receptor protein
VAPAAALAILALLAQGPALGAQEVPPPDSVLRVAPLTVEVLRTPLAGEALPFAVTGVELEELPIPPGGAFLTDALVALPGLQVQNRHNFAVGERIVVRGFGARAQFGVRGVRAVLDGIPATLPDGQTTLDHVDPASLGRVELLRGPGSAWWGNAAGGVLFMRSRRPETGRRGVVRTEAGSFGQLETTAAWEDGGRTAGDPVTRVGVTGVQWDGYRTNPVDGGLYGGADRWIVTGRHRRDALGGTLTLSVAGLDLDAENPGSLPGDSLGDDDRSAWGTNVRQRLGKTVRQGQVGAAWRGPVGGGLEGETALWGIGRELRNPIPFRVIEVDRVAGGARAGISSKQGILHWALGTEIEVQRDDRRNFGNDDGRNGELGLDQFETVLGTALFARAGGQLGPVDVHGAVRWDRIRFEADDRFLADGLDESGERTLSAVSPSLGLRTALLGGERPAGDGAALDLFGSVSAFMETPTTTELANRPDGAGGFNPELDPTRGWTGEVGVQGRAGARLAWEVVAFRTELRDELVPFEVPADPGRTFFRNAAESTHEGVEAVVKTELPGVAHVRAAWTTVDARFGPGQGEDLEGNRIPGRSPHRFETRLTRDQGLVRAVVDVVWSDAVPVDDANTAEAPAWWRVDVRLGPEPVRAGGWQLRPWLEIGNLFDEDYAGSVVVNAFGGRYFEPAPGRNLSLGASLTLSGG